MDPLSVEHAAVPSLSDDTGRHIDELETLTAHTDQTPSTYEILGYAISDDTTLPPSAYSLSALWNVEQESSTMPGAHGGLKPWPSIHSPTRDESSRNESTSGIKEQASVATLRSHYDSRRQPLTISQQTSASSVRDMALRKGSPAVLKKSEKSESRPLKSALKRYPSQQREQTAVPRFLYPPEHEQPPAQPQKPPSRFSLFNNFFSRRNSSHRSNPSPQVSRTSSTTSAASSHHVAPAGPRRKRSIGWEQPLQQYGNGSRSESAQSSSSDVVRQAKLAEGDVYERAKMNIRRPPKGIQNWFDGVDVSSDEDDDTTPVELPRKEALPATFPTFASKKADRRSQHEQQRTQLSKAERLLGQKTNIARFAQDNADDHLAPAYDRSRHPREDDEAYFDRAATPKASAQMRQQQRRYNNESALSMHSSLDGGETDQSGREHYDSDIAYGLATSMNVHRPQIPPRKLQPSQIASHNAYVNERPRLVTQASNSRYSDRSQDYRDDYEGRPQTASRKSSNRTSEPPRSRGRASTRMASINDDEDGGVPLDILSPEISHMMAVTEEEMALLEMMRNKKAAMQKSSYSEGYRQALKREHEQLVQKRMIAQQTAMRILRSQEEQNLDRRRQELDEQDADEKEVRKLNKLRLQEIDRMKRLEKFLAMDTTLTAALSDAGVAQDDDLVQSWPLPQHEALRSPEGRSRKSARTPSFSRRDVYDESTSRSRPERRDRSSMHDPNLALTLSTPPEVLSRHQDHHREMEAHLMRLESAKTQSGSKRESMQYAKHTINEAAYREERYTMSSQSVRPKQAQRLSRQQMQAATFLRSLSDYQGAEVNSVTSQGSASVSASVVSPMTPSSTGPAGKISAFDMDETDYLDSSSPELTFSRGQGGVRKQKHLPSALAIVAESDRSSYRGSMHSNNSAGEDVLAAWASLGGAETMLPARRPRGV